MMVVGSGTARLVSAPWRLAAGLALALILAVGRPASAQDWPMRWSGEAYPSAADPLRSGLSSDSAASIGAESILPSAPSGPVHEPPIPPESLSSVPLREGFDLRTWGAGGDPWCLQLLPDGLIYKSYLAGVKEPRFGSAWVHDRTLGWIWDVALGGRVGMLRYGSTDSFWPEGLQIDVEGAGFPRLDMEHDRDLLSADFRFGVPITWGSRRFQTKLAYYHLSSHLGDEYMVRYQTLSRINFSRDVLVWGNSLYATPNLRLYGEAAWAFYSDGGSEPWEFQFGIDYSPAMPSGVSGAPFLALNAHLREELNFGGAFVVQTGWQWRGESRHLFRLGMEYFTGNSDQFETFRRYEEKIGVGIWYDY
jgi:hypothetical protein